MRLCRAKVIWISSEGTGRMVHFSISPLLLAAFFILLLLCVSAVPCLETALLTQRSRTGDLDSAMGSMQAGFELRIKGLKAEMASLLYLKEAVAQIQENEKILRNHFGLEKVRSIENTSGLGGETIPFKSWSAQKPAGDRKGGDTGPEVSRELQERAKAMIANHASLSRLKIRQAELWEGTPSITPLDLENVKVSSPFGFRKSPFTNKSEFHAGVDFIGPKGAKVIAPANGKVFSTGYDQWMGNYVVLHHQAGIKTIYGHLSEISVREGRELRRGDSIGAVGNTGLSTSPHLHYGVIKGDRAVDPMQFVLDRKG